MFCITYHFDVNNKIDAKTVSWTTLAIIYVVAVDKGVVERRLGPTFNFQLTGPELLRMQCFIPEREPKC